MNFGRRLAAAVVAAVSGVAFAATDVPVTEGEVEFDTSKNSTSYTYVIGGGAVVKLPETAGALTLNATGALAGHEVKLRLTADTLYLDVLANGMTIIVR